jgi:GTP cyclohydrolase II
MRFQELMPDVLHWLGITRSTAGASMSNMKHTTPSPRQGIEVGERWRSPMN